MSIQEKYEAATKDNKLQRGTVWLTNHDMQTDPENPVLVSITEEQWASPQGIWQSQGYTKFVPAKKIDPPVEAKRAAEKTPEKI